MNAQRRHKLYVNLSGSQARKRLKGHGYGVRAVQSAGRDLAVIVHTATGQHRRELESLFADVGCSGGEPDDGSNGTPAE